MDGNLVTSSRDQRLTVGMCLRGGGLLTLLVPSAGRQPSEALLSCSFNLSTFLWATSAL